MLAEPGQENPTQRNRGHRGFRKKETRTVALLLAESC
jgi:hypothetical protein